MKNTIQLLFSISLSFMVFGLVQAQSLKVNTEKSNIRWYGEDITGKAHFGNLTLKSGTLDLQNDIISGGSFTVNMTSLSVEDLSGGGKAKLEGHLKSDDFFSVENNPEAVLIITQKGKVEGATQTLVGDLTIKGIVHPVEFTLTMGDDSKATALLTFDRAKYDVRFRSGSFFENLGDKLILDDIRLEVALEMEN